MLTHLTNLDNLKMVCKCLWHACAIVPKAKQGLVGINALIMSFLHNATGEMSDAGEVLMALYEHLLPAAANANQPSLLQIIFGLHVQVTLSCMQA